MNRHICNIVFAIILLTGCAKPYEKHYDLSVDAVAYTLPYTGDAFPLYVYCSGEWTAEFDAEQTWITIAPGTESGSGNGVVRLSYKDNDVAVREVNLVLKSGSFTQTVHITQKYNSTRLEVL